MVTDVGRKHDICHPVTLDPSPKIRNENNRIDTGVTDVTLDPIWETDRARVHAGGVGDHVSPCHPTGPKCNEIKGLPVARSVTSKASPAPREP